MTSRFSTSASRAQHTPKVCISKRAEAHNAIIPPWQRAVVTIDMPADDPAARPAIYTTTWLTRYSPAENWNYSAPVSDIYRISLTIAATITFTDDDVDLRIFPIAPGPGHPARQYRAACSDRAWSHTLYGGRSPIIRSDGSPAGIISIRFDGSRPPLA